jgi:putative DNA primase/helicase
MQPAGALAEKALYLRQVALYARFERHQQRGDKWVAADSPSAMADQYWALSRRELSSLRQLIDIPTLRPDGSLLNEAGYDAATGLFLTAAVPGLKVPARPTQDDAKRAYEVLSDLLKGSGQD